MRGVRPLFSGDWGLREDSVEECVQEKGIIVRNEFVFSHLVRVKTFLVELCHKPRIFIEVLLSVEIWTGTAKFVEIR